jgi:ATP-dependent RNA helicase DeaD
MTTTPTDFNSLGLHKTLVATVATLGYEEPTPIQGAAIPPLLTGRDILGQAATGTGKTAAFVLPLLSRLPAEPAATRALVLVPTRELAIQVAEAAHRYARGLGLRALPIYGGQPIDRQLRALRRGVHIVVATPGRALDHIQRGTLDLSSVETVVLDEADEMLDMGFAEDLEAILKVTPEGRQTALFSATMPPRIATIARRHLRDPVRIEIGANRSRAGGLPKIRQAAYIVGRPQKVAALARLLDFERPQASLVFCRTRLEVDDLSESLAARGYQVEALHGGFSQEQRDRVMRRFREGQSEVLVATDVAARGLDVERLTHVVNYDVPSAPEVYVHRIGRTGRAGREGAAITLVEPREHRLLHNIQQHTKQKILMQKLPTVADLRTRQLELTRASLREALVAGDLERFRVVVESLSGEFDIVEIAMAAVKLVHVTSGREGEEEEIRVPEPTRGRAGARAGARAAGPRPASRGDKVRGSKPGSMRPAPRGEVGRLYIGSGREDGIRPADLVGAIVNETGLSPRSVGAIEIADRFSLVEVPGDAMRDIVAILRQTRIKGRKVTIRPDTGAERVVSARRGKSGPSRRT